MYRRTIRTPVHPGAPSAESSSSRSQDLSPPGTGPATEATNVARASLLKEQEATNVALGCSWHYYYSNKKTTSSNKGSRGGKHREKHDDFVSTRVSLVCRVFLGGFNKLPGNVAKHTVGLAGRLAWKM